ncbi:MAG: cupin domain-containing protein [Candidatus Heimdallarchaeota archaeon]|nr:cupin domain-containing protein [Candidatus Heimdallarchaeota archaeon]
MVKTVKPFEIDKYKNPHGVDSRKLYDDPNAIIIQLTLEPGEKLRRHITPEDVIFYVLEGKGTVLIGDEEKEVDRDTLIESPKNIVHCWYNRSSEKLRFLVIKTPKPTTPTKFLD